MSFTEDKISNEKDPENRKWLKWYIALLLWLVILILLFYWFTKAFS